jgi:hypothetical protein
MQEHIIATTIGRDKPVALRPVEANNCTRFHHFSLSHPTQRICLVNKFDIILPLSGIPLTPPSG